MKAIAEVVLWLATIVPWVCGIAASTGAWQTAATVVFTPYAWVVFAEWLMAGGCP